MKYIMLQLLKVENMYKDRVAHKEMSAALYYKGQMDAFKTIIKQMNRRN